MKSGNQTNTVSEDSLENGDRAWWEAYLRIRRGRVANKKFRDTNNSNSIISSILLSGLFTFYI